MSKAAKDIAASVRARLLAVAKAQGVDFNQVLVRFALERMLYRLSVSKHADNFLLKGALLFALWYDLPHRPTRDADFLGFGASDLASIKRTFQNIASIDVEDDGIRFDPASISVEEIRKTAGYAGARVVIDADLAKARCKTQIDIGFGDAVTPGPLAAVYPVLLAEMPAPRIKTYPTYTVIAEKLHAIALLGMTNSRLKDYYDLVVLIQRERERDALDTDTLATAVAATFARRGLAVPSELPIGLTDEFSDDDSRAKMWSAFLRKNDLAVTPLADAVARIREYAQPALVLASKVRRM